jgi:hypothetical protein
VIAIVVFELRVIGLAHDRLDHEEAQQAQEAQENLQKGLVLLCDFHFAGL